MVAVSKDGLDNSGRVAPERFGITGQQILIYIGDLSEGNPLQLSFAGKVPPGGPHRGS